ncbi:MAG TPA: bifunctional alpha,alpha-trehalose-phosphate synthase (UDP-forming)/trehalose-phosphatase [Cytophagales bacterium]|nr:bifunctional alpha,alpha-trehalose-phosphate synthase (UDP-forming)/trehalose-phosphatase [Cytophagales bacterium]
MNKRNVIISYRLPFGIKQEGEAYKVSKSSGGLVSAMSSLERSQKATKDVWVGCADFERSVWDAAKHELDAGFEFAPVFLKNEVQQNFYNGFSNSVLWPLFHYYPSYVDYQERYFEAYRSANYEVAQEVIKLLQPDDVVWIHDYHFMGLAQHIRAAKPEVKMGFFLHIPFPSYEVFRIMPTKCKNYLLNGLLGNDLIGFHTDDYNIHFLDSLYTILGVEQDMWKIQYQNRTIQTGVFPISVDFNKFNDAFDDAKVEVQKKIFRDAYPNFKIIFSVDRLDYSKGVMQRLEAMELFLEKYPDWKEKFVCLFVTVPSRDEIQKYWERKDMIEQTVSRINGKHGTLTWLPIVYQYSSLSSEQLSALYATCDLALITPIRDGMNLVAKEFVATRRDEKGVLILSELAGAARELHEAFLINPLDIDEISEKIKIALELPSEEQQSRMQVMRQRIKDYDVHKWARSFMETLLKVKDFSDLEKGAYLDYISKNNILDAYQNAQQCLFLFDYDGTLINFSSSPGQALPSQPLLKLLKRLSSDTKNKVVIISGRDADFMDSCFGNIPVDMVAEHGAMVKQKGIWEAVSIDGNNDWQKAVANILEDFTLRTPSTFVERKKYALVWHYRNINNKLGHIRAKELVQTLFNLLRNNHFVKITEGNKIVEVKSIGADKGTAATKLAAERPYDFVLAIGDDTTDEDMFKVLQKPHHHTIKVGSGTSYAKYALSDVQQVVSFLESFQQLKYHK